MTTSKPSIGNQRWVSDLRQYGGLLFAFSSLITMNSLTNIAAISAGGGNTPTEGLPLYNLIAAVSLCVCGLTGMALGFQTLVMDTGNKTWTAAACVITQLSWLPFLGGLTGVTKGAMSGNAFFPSGFVPAPSSTDVAFVGSMGFFGILGYAAAFVGSLGFMEFAILAYQRGLASHHAGHYFRTRAVYYNILVLLAGFSQLALGAYLLSRFGSGPYPAPVIVSVYTVFFPEISVFVGLVQLAVGFWGIARRYGIFDGANTKSGFLGSCAFMWLSMLSLQILVQIGYGVGGDIVPRAPTLGCMYLALAVMPAYLDFKYHDLPEVFPPEYYGDNASSAGDIEVGA